MRAGSMAFAVAAARGLLHVLWPALGRERRRVRTPAFGGRTGIANRRTCFSTAVIPVEGYDCTCAEWDQPAWPWERG